MSNKHNIHMYIYICMLNNNMPTTNQQLDFILLSIYIHTYTPNTYMCVYMYVYVYIYIYMHTHV